MLKIVGGGNDNWGRGKGSAAPVSGGREVSTGANAATEGTAAGDDAAFEAGTLLAQRATAENLPVGGSGGPWQAKSSGNWGGGEGGGTGNWGGGKGGGSGNWGGGKGGGSGYWGGGKGGGSGN